MSGRPKGSKNVPWGAIVTRLRKQPGRWMPVPEMAMVPARTLTVIRKRERRELRLDDGVIRARVRATAILEGQTLCTLWLKFEPKEIRS